MSEEFKVEIINPEKSFISKDKVTEVVVPAYEGDIGILKDHISIISFLKPGIIKILEKNEEERYYVEDGIMEFKDNSLSILTSSIYNIKEMKKNSIDDSLKYAEKLLSNENLDDQQRFLINQKIDVLKSLNIN
jgi:F-type H+-transporting ATPase subunit epsilon|tara:strand:+ start:252 stop:650 length:399 start_codon:yes stop_codon:yes gene_type:complete